VQPPSCIELRCVILARPDSAYVAPAQSAEHGAKLRGSRHLAVVDLVSFSALLASVSVTKRSHRAAYSLSFLKRHSRIGL
jgi:hypothetical protein